ncbi:MAG TPA: DNA-processing protein DprA, partial [Geminicoccaceae bacterium]|nr:DNA-processing protein DprA [Geminicoccaceae bacterium]
MARPLSPAEKLDRLQLSRCGGVGPIGFAKLMQRFGTARRALAELPRLAREAGGGDRFRPCPRAEAEAEFEQLERRGWHLVALGEPAYPELLAAIEDAPPFLTVRGDPAALAGLGVGIVGARNASGNGRLFARRLAAELAGRGLVVVSGLARGIDTAAHEGALEPAGGATVAVIASGADVPYPEENAGLMERIAGTGGAVVSERPLGSEPQARHFPRRNRLISGLSRGIVVVEAAPGSGSLITARMAAEQGREVMAVPGSPLDPRHRGTNKLLRDGAALVEGAEDVLALLEPILAATRSPRRRPARRREAPAAAPTGRT